MMKKGVVVLTAAALVCPVLRVAADTFLLKDGGKVYGESEKTFAGPDKQPWVSIKAAFGSVDVPAAQIKSVLKTKGDAGTVYIEEILVTFIKGQVEKSADGGKTWTVVTRDPSKKAVEGTQAKDVNPLPLNHPNGMIAPGDRVRTGPDSEADLDVGYGVIHLAAGSEIEFRKAGGATMKVFSGSAAGRMEDVPKGRKFTVETPQGVMGVKGTMFLVGVTADATRIAVEEGAVEFERRTVKAGETLVRDAGGVKIEKTQTDADRGTFARVRKTFSVPKTEMVCIPAGEFTMGSDDGDPDAKPEEKPSHKVYLDAYWMDKTEVTVGQFRRFVEATGYVTEAEKSGGASVCMGTKKWEQKADASWKNPYCKQDDTHPVVCVSWNDAVAYCDWAGKRLQTEAEWEKGARGTDGRMYPWGKEWDSNKANAEYKRGGTMPVGSYVEGASPWGLMDMAGNVREWSGGWYDEGYYKKGENRNPRGPGSGQVRVLRGSSWGPSSAGMRSADRCGYAPTLRCDDWGFRCARDAYR